jgi:hypothetical protein
MGTRDSLVQNLESGASASRWIGIALMVGAPLLVVLAIVGAVMSGFTTVSKLLSFRQLFNN